MLVDAELAGKFLRFKENVAVPTSVLKSGKNLLIDKKYSPLPCKSKSKS